MKLTEHGKLACSILPTTTRKVHWIVGLTTLQTLHAVISLPLVGLRSLNYMYRMDTEMKIWISYILLKICRV